MDESVIAKTGDAKELSIKKQELLCKVFQAVPQVSDLKCSLDNVKFLFLEMHYAFFSFLQSISHLSPIYEKILCNLTTEDGPF